MVLKIVRTWVSQEVSAFNLALGRILLSLLLLVDVLNIDHTESPLQLFHTFPFHSLETALPIVWSAVLIFLITGYHTKFSAILNYILTTIYVGGFSDAVFPTRSFHLAISILFLFLPISRKLSLDNLHQALQHTAPGRPYRSKETVSSIAMHSVRLICIACALTATTIPFPSLGAIVVFVLFIPGNFYTMLWRQLRAPNIIAVCTYRPRSLFQTKLRVLLECMDFFERLSFKADFSMPDSCNPFAGFVFENLTQNKNSSEGIRAFLAAGAMLPPLSPLSKALSVSPFRQLCNLLLVRGLSTAGAGRAATAQNTPATSGTLAFDR